MIQRLIVKSERRLRRERSTVIKMIALYCHGHHGSQGTGLCDGCEELVRYVDARLQRCPFGEDKPTCNHCPIHCYRPEIREKIKRVMRYSGPRMFTQHPILTVFHFVDSYRGGPPSDKKGATARDSGRGRNPRRY